MNHLRLYLTLVAALVAFVVMLAIDPHGYVQALVVAVVGLLLVGLYEGYLVVSGHFRCWWQRKCEAMLEEMLQRRAAFLPESVREGSPLMTVPHHEFLVGVYAVDNEERVLIGSGFRMGDYIVTAAHVVFDSTHDNGHLTMLEIGGSFVRPGKWTVVAADMAITPCDPNWLVAKAPIAPVTTSTHAQVCSAQRTQNASLGILRHVPEVAPGVCEYTGSTRPGFSGSPYFTGQRVLGMHVGGGATNYGYSASWMEMQIRKFVKRGESSEIWAIRKALKSARKSDFEVLNTGDPDEVEIRVGGRYYLLDRAEFLQLRREDDFQSYFDYDVQEHVDRTVRFRPARQRFVSVEDFGDYDEPEYFEYEPECDAAAKNGLRPPSTSSSRASSRATACQTDPTPQIPTMDTLMEAIMPGLKEQQQQSIDLLRSILDEEVKRQQATVNSAFESMNSQLDRLRFSIGQLSEGLHSQEKKLSEITSGICSGPSTSRALPDLAVSPSTAPSETRWDGMDSHFEKLKMWRSSNVSSSPDYVRLREAFLDSLGLNSAQKKAIIARLRNSLEKAKKKAKVTGRTVSQPPSPPTQ